MMTLTTPRIDAHVHFYTARDLARVEGRLPYALPAPHPLSAYLDTLIDAGVRPTLLNNVHLSILPDSENVFASFDELARLQERDPPPGGMATRKEQLQQRPFLIIEIAGVETGIHG